MFNEDPNKKCMVPVADVVYRVIDHHDPHKYEKSVPDHVVLRMDTGDTRGPKTYIAYAARSTRKNPHQLSMLIDALARQAKRDLLTLEGIDNGKSS